MNKTEVQTSPKPSVDEHERNAELEKRVEAEGLDLNHPQGLERFEQLARKSAKPVK